MVILASEPDAMLIISFNHLVNVLSADTVGLSVPEAMNRNSKVQKGRSRHFLEIYLSGR